MTIFVREIFGLCVLKGHKVEIRRDVTLVHVSENRFSKKSDISIALFVDHLLKISNLDISAVKSSIM